MKITKTFEANAEGVEIGDYLYVFNKWKQERRKVVGMTFNNNFKPTIQVLTDNRLPEDINLSDIKFYEHDRHYNNVVTENNLEKEVARRAIMRTNVINDRLVELEHECEELKGELVNLWNIWK